MPMALNATIINFADYRKLNIIETENPNAAPIGTKFGLFLFGEANAYKNFRNNTC